jgi:hypothetical protein
VNLFDQATGSGRNVGIIVKPSEGLMDIWSWKQCSVVLLGDSLWFCSNNRCSSVMCTKP